MTAIAAFNPPTDSPQQFQATLDGTVYIVRIPWNLYRRGWYVETRDTSGTLLYNAALAGSPPDFDLSLTLPSFTNKLVYRVQSGMFEVVERMRFYDIQVMDAPNGPVSKRPDGTEYRWTSFMSGVTLLGAQQIEFDIPVTGFATPIGGASLRIWGVALQDIAQSANLNGKSIQVSAGMKPGLPLATAQSPRAGVVLSGMIQQAFGNWINTDQYLEFVIFPPIGDPSAPLNLTFTWKKGQPLAEVIKSTLKSALPGYDVVTNINPNVVLAQDEPGYFASVTQFAAYLRDMSRSVLKGDYQGIDILLNGTTFTVYDGSTQAKAINIDFTDIIGQPTWIGPNQMQLNVVMRADLGVGSFLQLPQAQFTTTAPAMTRFMDRSAFQGLFQTSFVRHVGNFRQPSAESWITTLNCFPATK